MTWWFQDFPEVGTRTLRNGGRQHSILPNFLKNCMKLKEFGPGGHRKFYYVDPPLAWSVIYKFSVDKVKYWNNTGKNAGKVGDILGVHYSLCRCFAVKTATTFLLSWRVWKCLLSSIRSIKFSWLKCTQHVIFVFFIHQKQSASGGIQPQ